MDLVMFIRSQMKRMTPEPASLSKLLGHASGKPFGPYALSVHQTTFTVVLRWNPVSNLEPFSLEPKTLPQDHHCPAFLEGLALFILNTIYLYKL
ncbi:hypothetical protein AVEN_169095-1 [Araneus ventricosus]|uniref:Uncharacterized protein n=1 Tax=Araneus ventricosus TaxID=182803 RepID=A0A4Y2RIQ0_ARAVE|nr:hypothetical protein AVEN_169095-1 [Araneus ventricosus]